MLKGPRKLETPESGWMISETIFEPKTFQLQRRSATQYTVMLSHRRFGTRRARVIVEGWRMIVKCIETSNSAALLYVYVSLVRKVLGGLGTYGKIRCFK